MKNLLMSLAFLASSAGAQSVSRAFYEQDDLPVSVATIDGIHYYVTHGRGANPQARDRVHCVLPNGDVRFNKLITGTLFSTEDMIVTKDKKLLMVGTEHSCDYSFDSKRLIKLDTNGAVIFSTVFFGSEFWLLRLIEDANSNYYVTDFDKVHKFSTGGVWQSTLNPNTTSITCGAAIGNDLLISGFNQSGTKLVKIDNTGSVTASASSGVGSKVLISSSGSAFIVVNDTQVQKRTAGLVFQSVYTPTFNIADVVLQNDTLYLLGEHEEYEAIDSSFNRLFSKAGGPACSHGKALAISHGQAVVLNGVSGFSQPKQSGNYSGITVFPKLSSFTHPFDIGVVSFEHLPGTDLHAVPVYSGTVTRFDLGLLMSVTVRNFGTESVNEFDLIGSMAPSRSEYCQVSHYREHFSGISLAPGDSVTVTTSPFYVYWYQEVPGTYTLPTYPKAERVYARAPNGRMDGDCSNDHVEKTIPVTVGLKKEPLPPGVHVFPNPAAEHVTLRSPVPMQRVGIRGIDGRLLMLKHTDGAKEELIDTSELDPGVYTLFVISEGATWYGKVIKR